MKLNVWALSDDISVVKLSNCDDVQGYTSKIQSYVNDFKLCSDTVSSTDSGMMWQSEHTY